MCLCDPPLDTVGCIFSLLPFPIFSPLLSFCISFPLFPMPLFPPAPAHLLSPLFGFRHFTHPQSPSHKTCLLICEAWAWDVGWSNLCPLWYDNSIFRSSEIKSMRKKLGQLSGKMSFPHARVRASSPACPSSSSLAISYHLRSGVASPSGTVEYHG